MSVVVEAVVVDEQLRHPLRVVTEPAPRHEHQWHLAEVHFCEGATFREFHCAWCVGTKVE